MMDKSKILEELEDISKCNLTDMKAYLLELIEQLKADEVIAAKKKIAIEYNADLIDILEDGDINQQFPVHQVNGSDFIYIGVIETLFDYQNKGYTISHLKDNLDRKIFSN